MNQPIPADRIARLAALLRARHGAENGITIDSIQEALSLANRREAEDLCEQAFEMLGFVVVAGNSGYFRPCRAKELNDYARNLRRRADRLYRRMAILDRIAPVEGWRKESGDWSRPGRQTEFHDPAFQLEQEVATA